MRPRRPTARAATAAKPRGGPAAGRSASGAAGHREVPSAPLALALIALAAAIAYANGLRGPFLFDDLPNIAQNLRLRHLWPLWLPLGATARPVVMATFAMNYALGGLDVFGYHVTNLLIHALAGAVLFDVVRRTLRLPALAARFGDAANGIALAAAAMWVAHPLGSQAVSYLVQRGESLASLFYLVTLDAAILAATARGRARAWQVAAIVACGLGAATKPVVVSAPLLVLLYDRCFLYPSLREVLRRRALLLAGLAASWLVIAALAIANPDSSAGPGSKIPALAYAATQPGVVLHYLRLVIWPHPLVLDYGWPLARTAAEIVPPLLVLAALAAAVVAAAVRRRRVAFLGVAFALVLGPTSSLFPIDDPAFEHRMYLALAAPCVLAALAGHELLVRRARRPALAAALAVGLVALLAAVTMRRNRDYASEVAMWTQVVRERPNSARAHSNLGRAWVRQGDGAKAEPEFVAALRIDSTLAEARNNLGSILVDRGELAAAIPLFRRASADDPGQVDAHFNLGHALAGLGRYDEAIAEYRRFLARRPLEGRVWNALGAAQSASGRDDLAIASYSEAVRVQPELAAAHNNLGIMRVRRGDVAGGIAEFEEALRRDPGFEPARRNLEGAQRLEQRQGGSAGR